MNWVLLDSSCLSFGFAFDAWILFGLWMWCYSWVNTSAHPTLYYLAEAEMIPDTHDQSWIMIGLVAQKWQLPKKKVPFGVIGGSLLSRHATL